MATWLGSDIVTLKAAYESGKINPVHVVQKFIDLVIPAAYASVWISRFSDTELLERAKSIEQLAKTIGIAAMPLYGVLVAIKDNIDVRGLPTTAACPAFSYSPRQSAKVVKLLEEAGAIIVGKTNLDQFATGLAGVRSPYGEVRNAFDADYISGGSSSGSAVAIALGQVHLALGTDTAGSVPAALNNIVGLKPTRGIVNSEGVVPACRTLDCISLLTRTVADAVLVLSVIVSSDPDLQKRRPEWAIPGGNCTTRIAIPQHSDLEFFGDNNARWEFEKAIDVLRSLGMTIEEIDFSPFAAAAKLLYDGPFVAERLEAAGELLCTHPESIHPVVADILRKGSMFTAKEAFGALHQISALQKQAAKILSGFDALAVPSVPTIYTRAELDADPFELNSRLGVYTNAVNLLDLCALAIPTGFRADRMPAGITLLAPAMHDLCIAKLGQRIQNALRLPLGAIGLHYPGTPATFPLSVPSVRIAVVGAHLPGMPLNSQLIGRNAKLICTTHTASIYRLYQLKDEFSLKPALVRDPKNGAAIQVEVWEMPTRNFGSFVSLVPAPFGIGTVFLRDGSTVQGFICEPCGIEGAEDITQFGGWKNYITSRFNYQEEIDACEFPGL